MIGFLRGNVVQLLQDYCLLDVGGVGYRVYIPSSTRSRLKVGEDAMLYTHLAVREDAMTPQELHLAIETLAEAGCRTIHIYPAAAEEPDADAPADENAADAAQPDGAQPDAAQTAG